MKTVKHQAIERESRFIEDHAGLKSCGLSHLAVWDAGRLTLHPLQKAPESVA